MKTKSVRFIINFNQMLLIIKTVENIWEHSAVNKVPQGVVLRSRFDINNFLNEIIVEADKEFSEEEIWHRLHYCPNKMIIINYGAISEPRPSVVEFRFDIEEDFERMKKIFSFIVNKLELSYLPPIDSWVWENNYGL